MAQHKSKRGGHNRKPETWWTNGRGYIEGRVWINATTQRRVRQHRFVMEGMIGRRLRPDEDVHHKDGDKTNNSPDNLEIVTHGKHATDHNLKRKYKKGYRLKLTAQQRRDRSIRAKKQGLHKLGLAALAKAQPTSAD